MILKNSSNFSLLTFSNFAKSIMAALDSLEPDSFMFLITKNFWSKSISILLNLAKQFLLFDKDNNCF